MSNKIAHENFIDDFSTLLQSDREFVIQRSNIVADVPMFQVIVYLPKGFLETPLGEMIIEESDDLEVALEHAVARL